MGVQEKMATAIEFFTGKGWTKEQAAGIVGNLYHESGGLNIRAIGDGGKAFGLAQWHPDRQAKFASVMGKSIRQSTYNEQLAFVDWELNNSESAAGNLLRKAKSVAQAVKAVMFKYERPANGSSYGARLAQANKALGTDPALAGSAGESELNISDYDPTGIVKGVEFVNNLFTAEFAARFAAVVIGVILIGLAIAAFTLLGKDAVVAGGIGKLT